MKLREIYQLVIELGKGADPRGESEVQAALSDARREFEALPPKEQTYFDQERLSNPYSDTRILNGQGDEEINRLLTGVDMELSEVLLAQELSKNGQQIDLILSHHPEGKALAGLFEVMKMQEEIFHRFGVPIALAEGVMDERIAEVSRGILPLNHNRAIDGARLLGYPFMSCHTPADNMVTTFLQRIFDEKQPRTVGDVMDLLLEQPEYQVAARQKMGMKVVSGDKKHRAGRVFVDMTGGTGGSKEIFEHLANKGIGTIVGMHISEKNLEKAKEHHVNIVIAGHIASDSLGMNLVLDQIERRGVEILTCSGLVRVKR
jgi:putative NIF3 family GTP cyclohydrolase 1 type 2